MRKREGTLLSLIAALAGLIIWFAYFGLVYGVQATLCVIQGDHAFLAYDVLTYLVAATVLAIALTLLVGARSSYSFALLESGQKDRTDKFLHFVSATIAGFASVAIIWVGMAILMMQPC